MDERASFVLAFETARFSMSELCSEYGVSRKTGYKWLSRFREGGIAALADQSRAPHACPHRMSEEMERLFRQERGKHPYWGPRKLLDVLHKSGSEALRQMLEQGQRLPAASTVGEALKRAGLVHSRKRRSRPPHPGSSDLSSVAINPNDVWSTDFKGEFRTQDGRWCYPLTVSDAVSRYLLECKGLPSTEHAGARPCFERLFRENGLPAAIRSDNGCPFSSVGLCGLSRLSVWWMKLGIVHQRIAPGKPQQNGRHERMHRTLKAETTRPPARDMQRQQERFAQFCQEYNQERPHEALGMQTPSSIWTPSERAMPERLPQPTYPGHMEVRSVRNKGEIKFLGQLVFVSEVLAEEHVALEEVEDGIWSLYFCYTLLGRINQREMKGSMTGEMKLVPIRHQTTPRGNEGKRGTDQPSQRPTTQ
jgi:transposase InsO family protein